MEAKPIQERLERQRAFYASGATRDPARRIAALKRLREVVRREEGALQQALWKDLHKSAYEAYLTETGIVLHEIEVQIRHLRRWSKTKRVATPLFLRPSRSRIVKEPYGHALVIAPWNYPFQLSWVPVIAAVAAGNVVALKPSHKAATTAAITERIVREVFPDGWVECFVGETEISSFLLARPFDYIFFTGSPRVGKIVMEAAARNLTPVVLELGGKSPAVVDQDADLRTAARRIVWGKLINAGQTCIAPDYLLVHNSVKVELLKLMEGFIREFYGDDPQKSPDYPRIVSAESVDRLAGLMSGAEIYAGGAVDRAERYVAPTILTGVKPADPVMREEIFGPILPVLTFEETAEAVDFINARPKPLALYYFGRTARGKKFIRQTSSGGGCINDTLLHVSNPNLPFGGVGNSGMGNYHGRYGFEAFTHRRAILISRNRFDASLKFPPFKSLALLKKLMR